MQAVRSLWRYVKVPTLFILVVVATVTLVYLAVGLLMSSVDIRVTMRRHPTHHSHTYTVLKVNDSSQHASSNYLHQSTVTPQQRSIFPISSMTHSNDHRKNANLALTSHAPLTLPLHQSPYTFVAPPVFKDIIVRSVYFDSRPRSHHRNASVFMLEVAKPILEQHSIVGCAVGEHFTIDFDLRVPHCMSWLHEKNGHLTHEPVMLDCFDLPGTNGSEAFVVYKHNNHTFAVKSEHPFMIPAPHHPPPNPQRYNFSVATCIAVLYGRPTFLIDWLRYQKTVGIDHVHMIAENSFEALGGFNHPYLKQKIKEGYVTVNVWHRWHKRNGMYYHSQPIAHEDCLYRLHGTYDYAFILDQDDFFIPRIPDQQTVHYYIETLCPHGSCAFEWHEYYPNCGMENKAQSDGNLTRSLKSRVFTRRSHTKSVHTLSGILDAGPHAALKYMRGFKVKKIPEHKAYVAHVRIGRKPPRC